MIKTSYKKLLLTLVLLALSACAHDISRYIVPVPDTVKLSAGEKVGVINFLRSNPTHTNVGLLVWENFSKEIATDWEINQLLERKVVSSLNSVYAEVLMLDSQLFDEETVTGMVLPKDGEFHIKNADQIAEFKERYGLKALVVIGQSDLSGVLYGTTGNTELKHYGIFTSGPKKYLSVNMINHYALSVFHFEPTIASGLKQREVEPNIWKDNLDASNVSALVSFDEIKNVTSDEMDQLEEKMLQIAEKVGDNWAGSLQYTFK